MYFVKLLIQRNGQTHINDIIQDIGVGSQMSMRWIIDIYGWDGWTQFSQTLLTLFVSLREEKD